MLETVYLNATSEELEGLLPKLENMMSSRLEIAKVDSFALDESPEDAMELPSETTEGEVVLPNCAVEVTLTPTSGEEIGEDYLDALGLKLIEGLSEVLKDFPKVSWFSLLEP